MLPLQFNWQLKNQWLYFFFVNNQWLYMCLCFSFLIVWDFLIKRGPYLNIYIYIVSYERGLILLNYLIYQNRNIWKIVKIVSEPEDWSVFVNYFKDIKIMKRSFHSSEFIHIPWTQNSRADSLARSAKKQLSFIIHIHMDAELPVWFAEFIWIYLCWW